MKILLGISAAALGLFALAGPLRAQNIDWGAAENMTGDSDIETNGVYFDAITIYPTSLTDNGVLFHAATTAFPISSGTDISITSSDGSSPGAYSSHPFNLGSITYGELTETGCFGESTDTVTISNLTAGDTYQVQSWSYYNGDPNAVDTTYSGSTPVGLNNSIGQFAIGTFTAPLSGVEDYTFSTTNSHNFVNAVSVFDTTASVPEPATYGMLVGGFGMLLAGQRIRRRIRS